MCTRGWLPSVTKLSLEHSKAGMAICVSNSHKCAPPGSRGTHRTKMYCFVLRTSSYYVRVYHKDETIDTIYPCRHPAKQETHCAQCTQRTKPHINATSTPTPPRTLRYSAHEQDQPPCATSLSAYKRDNRSTSEPSVVCVALCCTVIADPASHRPSLKR